MLAKCDVKLKTDYITNNDSFKHLAKKTIYTGTIDSYYRYCFGPLEYRSLRFEHEKLQEENYQGVAVVNYTDCDTPFTRVIEHKHFEFGTQPETIITREYPVEWSEGMEPYYPINNRKNQERYKKYQNLASQETNIIFGGRLGTYKYTDMQDTIVSALEMSRVELD